MIKRVKSIVIAALAVLIGVVYAVPAPSASAISSSALSIAPKKNYVIEPGKSVDDKLVIRNIDTQSALQLTLRVIDFSYTDDTGTPKLILDPNASQTTWSLKSYLSVPKSVTVAPGESESVDISIDIPKKQGAGSFYSAILYSTGAPDGGNVGLSASGVTLVFVSVPGEVNEKLTLQRFGAYKDQTPSSPAGYVFIATDMPKLMAYTLKNDGNVTESPVGSIKLKHMFGSELTIDDVNTNNSLALIGQNRTFTTCIKEKTEKVELNGDDTQASQCVSPGLWPGMYTASLDIFYGQNGNKTQEITKTAVFWYLPWWFIIALLVVIALISYFVWRVVTFVRRKLYGPKFKSSRRR